MPPIAFTYECDGMSQIGCFNETYKIPFPAADTAFPHNVTRSFRRAYYACVSFTDYMIGKLQDKIESVGRANDTIIALIGDHGKLTTTPPCTKISCNMRKQNENDIKT